MSAVEAVVIRAEHAPCPVCGQVTLRREAFHAPITRDTPAARLLATEAAEALAAEWQPDHRHARCTPREERP